MGNAAAAVRAAADIVVPTSDEDGVIDALEWFFPHQGPFERSTGEDDGVAVPA